MKVAFTLEQAWHEVPGGTYVAARGMALGLLDRPGLSLLGVTAAHRRPAADWPAGLARKQLPLPRVVLYELWHRARLPRVEAATGPVDVVHATAFPTPSCKAPLVVTVHDLAFRHDPGHFTAHGVRFFERGLELARRHASLVHVPSEATKDDLLHAGFEDERVRVVPLGVDTAPAGEAAVARVRAAYGIARPYVLWTGTIEPRKNLARLVAAFDALDDLDLELVLVGPRGWKESAEMLTGGRARVKVLGFVPRDHLDALYAGAAVFCLPSIREGFGFPVLEAMAHGAPVVTSRGTSTAEVAGDAALLVDPLDPGAIADALRTLVEDQGRAHALRRAGPARAALFTWERTAEGIAAVYREAAG